MKGGDMMRAVWLSTVLGVVAVAVLPEAGSAAQAASGRRTISLAGMWQLAEGALDVVPKTFDHQAPVPGLADMATPALEGVGVKDDDPRRAAFWYRRTFQIEGSVPAVALLKIHKARYGTRVFLNGQPLGDHVPCFTPGYFDLRPHLKGSGQENELLIRVGASHKSIPETVPWGHDFEKTRYIPGIYDAVDLILTGSPTVVRVQAVPDLDARAVRVVALVRLADAVAETTLRCTVREAVSGKLAGTAESARISPAAGGEQAVEVTVPIESCRLWSPEDPFLYELEAATGADRVVTRFGMRTFRFDPETKRALLNGKPYFLRGTNICIDRFFEDPARADKPWNEAWVRSVIRAFRSMHWNACRYCIGFPPELWYRIADEEGLMVQDEFPVWGQTGSLEALTEQYTAWMQERWNHPCVVVWDAQNETPRQDVTSQALTAVRGLDLSDRPWDNGWAATQRPTDVYEAHPYAFGNPHFQMGAFARLSPKAGSTGSWSGNALPNRDDNPVIINEYGWLWLNRDGTPTTLTTKAYERLMPPDATAEQRREVYARLLAAKTEFWRCGRQVAGVLHFCGLGYSRTGGQTSDNFIDIEKPTFEPHFYRYVRDAFAPVGLMFDVWSDELPAGQKSAVRVVVINDLDREWQGAVSLELRDKAKPAARRGGKMPLRVGALGREQLEFQVDVPSEPGAYQLVAELPGADGEPVRSLRDFAILTAEQRRARDGLTLGKPVQASSATTKDGQTYPAAHAVDGDPSTRWSSDFSDPQWLAVDLGAPTRISRVQLLWEGAFGKAYSVQVSQDGQTWTDVYQTETGKGGTEELRFAPVEARWVRYYGTKRGTQFGHSLWEFRVFP
jgi:beta-galactosidase